jgi:hypothetical protein
MLVPHPAHTLTGGGYRRQHFVHMRDGTACRSGASRGPRHVGQASARAAMHVAWKTVRHAAHHVPSVAATTSRVHTAHSLPTTCMGDGIIPRTHRESRSLGQQRAGSEQALGAGFGDRKRSRDYFASGITTGSPPATASDALPCRPSSHSAVSVVAVSGTTRRVAVPSGSGLVR